jgi:hypothetical protein
VAFSEAAAQAGGKSWQNIPEPKSKVKVSTIDGLAEKLLAA